MTRTLITGTLLAILVFVSHARAHEEYGFVGTLSRIELAKNRVTLKYEENSKEETLGLILTPKTEIMDKDRKPLTRAALKAGVTVAVRAYGDGDATEMEALSIRIVPPINRK